MSTILITGAARGLGLELVKKFAEQGDRVYATTRKPENADQLNAFAESSSGKVTVHKMDVGDMDSVKSFAAQLGSTPIDTLINNAGVWGGLDTQVFENMDYENWHFELNVMLMGPFRVMQTFLDNVLASEKKRIVNITSQVAAHSYDHIIGYSYATAKAGLNRATTALARELKDQGVTVALLHPGWIKTDMAGDVADLEPEEAAAMNVETINKITLSDTGKFLKWNGEIHPW